MILFTRSLLQKNLRCLHRGFTESNARFEKHAFCFSLLALVMLAGAMFISCDFDSGNAIEINAKQPSISVQPVGSFWNVFPEENNTFNLSVTANITDAGNLTYQWFSNTSNSATGGVAIGTGNPLSLNKNNYKTNGSKYFYVIIKNTNNNANGDKTATTTSTVAEVTVAGNPDTAYTTSAMPENLKGTWIYEGDYPETYIIDETTFDSGYYKGTIAGHRSNNNGDGYITIEYTEANNPASIGQFYVIHYKGLTTSKISLSGAYLGADPDFDWTEGTSGKATQAEAEAVMTVSAGYFGMYSECNLYVPDEEIFANTAETKYIDSDGSFILNDDEELYSL